MGPGRRKPDHRQQSVPNCSRLTCTHVAVAIGQGYGHPTVGIISGFSYRKPLLAAGRKFPQSGTLYRNLRRDAAGLPTHPGPTGRIQVCLSKSGTLTDKSQNKYVSTEKKKIKICLYNYGAQVYTASKSAERGKTAWPRTDTDG